MSRALHIPRGSIRRAPLRWLGLAACVTTFVQTFAQTSDPLHSWNIGPTKTAILQFVADVTTEGGPHYVPLAGRIAVFSNDGTLCPEHPTTAQLAFVLDRVKALAPKHPQWKTKEPFKSALARNLKALAAKGSRGVLELMAATHAGMTTGEFETTVLNWLNKGRNPRLNRLYALCAYQPMLQLLTYMRANGFTTYLVCSGDVDFMRPWSEKAYGIPPGQIIGSSVKTKLEMRKGEPALVRRPELDFMDDKAGKPAGIYKSIGRRPIAAFGNSDADLELMQWITAGASRHLALLLRHTDGGNEFSYDRKSDIGRLDKALDMARKRGWIIADMTKDWNQVFLKVSKQQETK